MSNPTKKRYFIIRHGQSEANVKRVLASKLYEGCFDPHLTDLGKEQVTSSVSKFKNTLNGERIRIIASPFRRTRETADIVSEVLGIPYEIDARLAERDFGLADTKSLDLYEEICENDRMSISNDTFEVETPDQVLERVQNLLEELKGDTDSDITILVTHGDVSAITVSFFQGSPIKNHRSYAPIQTGEMCEIDIENAP